MHLRQGLIPQNAAVAATTGLLAVMNREGIGGSHRTRSQPHSQLRYSHLLIAVALASAITMLSSIGGRMMMVGWWP